MKTYTKNNRCTSVGSTSCMVYTGPSVPDLNIYCDSDLDDVLSILTTKVITALNSKGIDLSGIDTSCINISATDKKDLVKLLNAMINKLCALEVSGIGIQTNIDNVKVLLGSLPAGFFACLPSINYSDCDSEVTLTQLLAHVISEMCNRFIDRTDPTYQLIDQNYSIVLDLINNGSTSSNTITNLVANTGNTKVTVLGSITPVSLSSAISSINSTLGALINTVTGSSDFSTTLYVNPSFVGNGGYPSSSTAVTVKSYLGWLAYDVTTLKTEMGLLGGGCGSFSITDDSSDSDNANFTINNVRNVSTIQALVKTTAGVYSFVPIQSNITAVTYVSANLYNFSVEYALPSTLALGYEVIVYNGSNCVKSFAVGYYNAPPNPPID